MPTLTPLDDRFPIRQQLALDAGPVVLVNLIRLDASNESAFFETWTDDAAFMKRQPGFLWTQLHRALGPAPAFLNYAALESTAHFRNAFGHPDFLAKLGAYPSSITIAPHLFEKVAVPGICAA